MIINQPDSSSASQDKKNFVSANSTKRSVSKTSGSKEIQESSRLDSLLANARVGNDLDAMFDVLEADEKRSNAKKFKPHVPMPQFQKASTLKRPLSSVGGILAEDPVSKRRKVSKTANK